MSGPSPKRQRRERKHLSVLKRLRQRELGSVDKISVDDVPQASFRLPVAWRKRTVDPGLRNKIFASQWITNNHIVYGTKCNQLVLFDCNSNSSLDIPLIGNEISNPSSLGSCACGIHAIQLNPSRSLLATGGASVNQIGVYALSELSPYCLLKDCHTDWVFDLRWLDDSHLASCSRDSSLALWRIPEFENHLGKLKTGSSVHVQGIDPVPAIGSPLSCVVSAIPDDRFRAVEHLAPFNSLTVVSMSRRFYLYDAIRMGADKRTKPIFTLALRDAYQEAVALRQWPSAPHCVALATHHCVILFDIRCSDPVGATGCCIHPPSAVSGIRSLNFAGNILSYGSSNGQIHFYDLRGNQHLPTHLELGPGWVKPSMCANEDSFPPLPETPSPVDGNNWPPQTRNSSVWGAPPAPYSAVPVFLSHFPASSNSFVAHSNNLRIRLDRRQNRFTDLRSRRFASLIYSIAGLRQSDVNNRDVNYRNASNSTFGEVTSRRRRLPSTESDDIIESVSSGVRDNDNENEEVNNEDADVISPDHDELDVVTSEQQETEEETVTDSAQFSIWRLPEPGAQRTQTSSFNFPLIGLWSDFPSMSAISTHRRLVAVYTHEYDPSGTRLFTAGGPIASTYHGNVAALWE
ncbi:DDB1-and CUL4-associated factor 12 [Paragonimus skrjabini miyazakii]|uniref:DDB1-and CUL4-associated factor 12 n=1 Tax=Paragonimus skrjabini miyazakii TaxID=59628 RepID=A0A8S9YRR3_9TREM|nr:DDB1-and CUL4-associated factor 12 [Paragonimus skrjabini miyazakii]